jgi:hypothetical protein
MLSGMSEVARNTPLRWAGVEREETDPYVIDTILEHLDLFL